MQMQGIRERQTDNFLKFDSNVLLDAGFSGCLSHSSDTNPCNLIITPCSLFLSSISRCTLTTLAGPTQSQG
jgi:hypothetical protein